MLCVSVEKVVLRHTGLARDVWEAHSKRESHSSLLSLSLDPPSVSANSGEAIRVATDICNRNYFAGALPKRYFKPRLSLHVTGNVLGQLISAYL